VREGKGGEYGNGSNGSGSESNVSTHEREAGVENLCYPVVSFTCSFFCMRMVRLAVAISDIDG
jgi:hypothetical protein